MGKALKEQVAALYFRPGSPRLDCFRPMPDGGKQRPAASEAAKDARALLSQMAQLAADPGTSSSAAPPCICRLPPYWVWWEHVELLGSVKGDVRLRRNAKKQFSTTGLLDMLRQWRAITPVGSRGWYFITPSDDPVAVYIALREALSIWRGVPVERLEADEVSCNALDEASEHGVAYPASDPRYLRTLRGAGTDGLPSSPRPNAVEDTPRTVGIKEYVPHFVGNMPGHELGNPRVTTFASA